MKNLKTYEQLLNEIKEGRGESRGPKLMHKKAEDLMFNKIQEIGIPEFKAYAKNAVKKAFSGSAQKERGYGKEKKTTSLKAGVDLTVVFFVHTVGGTSLYGNLKSIESMEILLVYKIAETNKTEIRHKYRNGSWEMTHSPYKY